MFQIFIITDTGNLGGGAEEVLGDLAGWIYNLVARLSGGLEVELTEARQPRGRGEDGGNR